MSAQGVSRKSLRASTGRVPRDVGVAANSSAMSSSLRLAIPTPFMRPPATAGSYGARPNPVGPPPSRARAPARRGLARRAGFMPGSIEETTGREGASDQVRRPGRPVWRRARR